eukprot:TRINITY_DN53929_c0_g1_i1.p1 TRINITY_DN53929_c0_g1~~TRINITY_DN53929_c0_g1_i1.p1  ORF type:complete len:814 (+),score=177.41 TRINITY_DN53929_c0_g1_i1:307-2442(+)
MEKLESPSPSAASSASVLASVLASALGPASSPSSTSASVSASAAALASLLPSRSSATAAELRACAGLAGATRAQLAAEEETEREEETSVFQADVVPPRVDGTLANVPECESPPLRPEPAPTLPSTPPRTWIRDGRRTPDSDCRTGSPWVALAPHRYGGFVPATGSSALPPLPIPHLQPPPLQPRAVAIPAADDPRLSAACLGTTLELSMASSKSAASSSPPRCAADGRPVALVAAEAAASSFLGGDNRRSSDGSRRDAGSSRASLRGSRGCTGSPARGTHGTAAPQEEEEDPFDVWPPATSAWGAVAFAAQARQDSEESSAKAAKAEALALGRLERAASAAVEYVASAAERSAAERFAAERAADAERTEEAWRNEAAIAHRLRASLQQEERETCALRAELAVERMAFREMRRAEGAARRQANTLQEQLEANASERCSQSRMVESEQSESRLLSRSTMSLRDSLRLSEQQLEKQGKLTARQSPRRSSNSLRQSLRESEQDPVKLIRRALPGSPQHSEQDLVQLARRSWRDSPVASHRAFEEGPRRLLRDSSRASEQEPEKHPRRTDVSLDLDPPAALETKPVATAKSDEDSLQERCKVVSSPQSGGALVRAGSVPRSISASPAGHGQDEEAAEAAMVRRRCLVGRAVPALPSTASAGAAASESPPRRSSPRARRSRSPKPSARSPSTSPESSLERLVMDGNPLFPRRRLRDG